MLLGDAGNRGDRFDRLFPYLLLAVTMAALIPVLESGISESIGSDGYLHLRLSIGNWASLTTSDPTHPFLYYLVLRVPALFGHSKIVWRSASIIPGMASVYLLGLIAAKLCKNKAAALLAAAAYGFSETMREIFIDVRGYPLALFFVLASLYCVVNPLAGNARRNRSLIWFGIFTSLAIVTEYYAILFFFACVSACALLLASHRFFRERAMEWARRNWRVLIAAFGLPLVVIAYYYQLHIKQGLSRPALQYTEFCWRPGTSRIDFVLRNLRADLNYMLPIEMSSAGIALGVLAVFASLLLYRALFRKQSRESLAFSLPGLLFLLLLAELIVLSLLRLYPFGGYARLQSILFPFFTLTAFLLLDWFIDRLPKSQRLGWLPAAILGLAAAGIVANYSGVNCEDAVSSQAVPQAGSWGRAARPARTTAGQAGIRWVRIPGGTFVMGADDVGPSAQPRHKVTIRPFEMAQTLVTNKQYRACVDAGVCTKADSAGLWFEGDNQPVVMVDWEQAQVFSRWVGGRLPTEAEWEYAARSGGREQKYPWGDEEATCERAVIGGCGGYEPTAPVCSKPAGNTRQGLCDMAGNVWEWVQDGWHDSYNGAPTDGSAWESPAGSRRVDRGGSWVSRPGNVRSADRNYYGPTDISCLGFRPVRRDQ